MAERCRKLAEEVLKERVKVTEGEPQEEKGEGGSLRGHTSNSETIHKLKILQQGKRVALNELWDVEKKQFVTGEDDMADTIKAARRKLEHTDYMKAQAAQEPEGEPEPGQNLLDEWTPDFSTCRHYLHRREVEKGKSRGQTGCQGNY